MMFKSLASPFRYAIRQDPDTILSSVFLILRKGTVANWEVGDVSHWFVLVNTILLVRGVHTLKHSLDLALRYWQFTQPR